MLKEKLLLSVPLILLLIIISYFLLRRECRDGRPDLHNYNDRLRLLSITAPLIMVPLHLVMGDLYALLPDFLFPTAILLIYPCNWQNIKTSAKCSRPMTAAYFLFSFIGVTWPSLAVLSAGCAFFACVLPIVAYILMRTREKHVKPRLLFRTCSVIQAVDDYSRLMFSCLVLASACFLKELFHFVPDASRTVQSIVVFSSPALLEPLFVFLYLKALTGRTYVISRSKEETVREMIKGNLRDAMTQKPEDEQKMSRLYSKITAYMESAEPFLDDSFSLRDMSITMYSNKVYISKTINVMSGRNFRQFVNYYRVRYAAELMKKDPGMKIVEIASLSGFHNTVTFNQSFKYYMGETPSAYQQKQQDKASGFVQG